MTIAVADLPAAAVGASLRLRDELRLILGDDLLAIWLHGGTTFADRSARGDLDICAVITSAAPAERLPRVWRRDPAARPSRVVAAELALEKEFGVDFDATYLLADEMRADTPPPQAFDRLHRVHSWPVFRAHWLAGQYVLLDGRRPEELIVPPSARAMRVALDREVEHLERHVQEGDADDPDEATYGVLNSCRILHTVETGSPVLSKRSAGDWSLEHLAPSWHGAIRAAQRHYDGVARADDNAVLRDALAPFVAQVRRRLPTANRSMVRPPRWS